VALTAILEITAVAEDIETLDPPVFVAVTLTLRYLPTSAVTRVYVEFVAPEIFV
jgi:hypothetical protein